MSQPQTVNIADLDISQLSELRKQLEDVCKSLQSSQNCLILRHSGTYPSDQLFRATEASTGQVQGLSRECQRDQAGKYWYFLNLRQRDRVLTARARL